MNQRFYYKEGWLICQSLHSHEMLQIYNQSFPHLDCFGQVIYLPIHVTRQKDLHVCNWLVVFTKAHRKFNKHRSNDWQTIKEWTQFQDNIFLLYSPLKINCLTFTFLKNGQCTNATLVSSTTCVYIWMHTMTSIYCWLWVACKLNNKELCISNTSWYNSFTLWNPKTTVENYADWYSQGKQITNSSVFWRGMIQTSSCQWITTPTDFATNRQLIKFCELLNHRELQWVKYLSLLTISKF